MTFYEDTNTAESGSASTTSTPPSGSTDLAWAERLKAKYGLSQVMAPEEDAEPVADYLLDAVASLEG